MNSVLNPYHPGVCTSVLCGQCIFEDRSVVEWHTEMKELTKVVEIWRKAK